MAAQERIGFIGLGTMGAPMAGHLLEAGYEVSTAVHRKPPSDELIASGLAVLDSADAVARASDILIVMVPDTPDVEDVLFGEDGVVDGLAAGSLFIDMSSISPGASVGFAERAAAADVRYLDAPVSGGEVGAKNGTLTIMVGGDAADFERARPLFEVMGSKVTLIGPNGSGQACKVANQIVVAGTIQAVAEGLLFAAANGVDPAVVREALLGGLASSRILEVHGERMIKRTFDPGFRIELHAKDLGLALAGSRELSVTLPMTTLVQQLFTSCIAHDGGGEDHSALVRAIERMSATTVAQA